MTVGLSLVYGRQQYFRVQPRDVQVQEGGEAMLECEVANLAGQVQWTKDGFALGRNFYFVEDKWFLHKQMQNDTKKAIFATHKQIKCQRQKPE